jgi:SNF2 family DNA or RNA helicase
MYTQMKRPSRYARRSGLSEISRPSLEAACGPVGVLSGYAETPAKLEALDRLLERWVTGEGEKVVVWSFYTASLDGIVARYAPLGVVRYDGSVSSTEARREAVGRFQSDESTRVFVGNPAAGRRGDHAPPGAVRDLRIDVQPGLALSRRATGRRLA